MRKIQIVFFLMLLPTTLFCQPIRVFLVTGGHDFDTVRFFQLFDSFEGINYEHFAQPEANTIIATEAIANYDVFVFYDMWKTISEKEKQAYLKLTKAGKPFLFLHHSLASYQDWKVFESIIGGKYIEKSKNIPEDE